MLVLFNDDCLKVMKSKEFKKLVENENVIIVTDPPFNIGYHYNEYKDNLKEQDYYNNLKELLTMYNYPFVLIHYPESLYKISAITRKTPERVVSWVYNSNTAKQHRDIAFFGVKPDFNLVKQPYKNINDKRIKARIARGIKGGRLYDWWNINQVKNVSKKKLTHPCVMPIKVMENIIGILPNKNVIIFDPFMGSGTTALAALKEGMDFIGCELNKQYYDEAKNRIHEFIVGGFYE